MYTVPINDMNIESVANDKHSEFPLYCYAMYVTVNNIYVKVKFSQEQAMKAQRGSRGIDLLFL
jgi:hypothetical protein